MISKGVISTRASADSFSSFLNVLFISSRLFFSSSQFSMKFLSSEISIFTSRAAAPPAAAATKLSPRFGGAARAADSKTLAPISQYKLLLISDFLYFSAFLLCLQKSSWIKSLWPLCLGWKIV